MTKRALSLSRTEELPERMSVSQVAKLIGVSGPIIYESCHRYEAAERIGDVEGMRREMPCKREGGKEDQYGNLTRGCIKIYRRPLLAHVYTNGRGWKMLANLYGTEAFEKFFGDLVEGEPDGEAA